MKKNNIAELLKEILKFRDNPQGGHPFTMISTSLQVVEII